MAGILVRDANNGTVCLTSRGTEHVSYELGESEIKTIATAMEILGKMWFALEAKRIITSHKSMTIIEEMNDITKLVEEIINDPKNLLFGSAYPQSGNKIGTNQSDSVVDSDCKVHGFTNLFVCDASVFPTSVGVNPQISVMTVASIVASRIIKNWDNKYDNISLNKNLGHTCAISQPMYCLRTNLSELFNSVNSQFDSKMLVNAGTAEREEADWKFDPENLTVSNNKYWKGIFPRDSDIQNTLTLYFGGFWKRFTSESTGGIWGITHPFEVSVFARNKAIDKELDGFGKVILLEYLDPPYNFFYDVLKIVDQNTILGKAFLGRPNHGREILTFCMSRKYPLEFMTEEDHEMLYNNSMRKPTLDQVVGIWEGHLVSDSTLTDPVFRFRYYFDQTEKVLKNEYLLGGLLAGVAIVHEKGDCLQMQDISGVFSSDIRQVKGNIMIGKHYSETKYALRWLTPEALSFLHIDMSRPSIYLPYILKKRGFESALKGYRKVKEAYIPRMDTGLKSYYDNSYAIIIGISKYKEENSLPNAQNDASAVKDILEKKYSFNIIKSLFNEDATANNIREVFDDLLQDESLIGPNDRVLVYYSGHGKLRTTIGHEGQEIKFRITQSWKNGVPIFQCKH